MKQSLSEIRQLQKIAGILGAKIKPGVIRENEYKELKEEEGITIELKDDLTATLPSDASKKLTIPKGAKVTVFKKRLENDPAYEKFTRLQQENKTIRRSLLNVIFYT